MNPTSTTMASPPSFGAGLTKAEVERYSRQCLLPEVGAAGTAKFLRATVAVIGAGGLGTTVIPYLAAAGVGRLIIVDDDTVDRSNLHRQIIHTDIAADRDEPKALSAKRFVAALNPTTHVDAFVARLMPPSVHLQEDEVPTSASSQRDEIIRLLLTSVDVICDCTDNPAARYLLNDIAVRAGIPLVSGAAMRWDGQLTVYNFANRGPTYRCMFPRPPAAEAGGGAASCNDVGVFGPVPGMIGTLQATEALKVILTLESFRGSSSGVAHSDTPMIAAVSSSDAPAGQVSEKDAANRRRDREDDAVECGPATGCAAVDAAGPAALVAAEKYEPPRSVLAGRMLIWNAWTASFRVIAMRQRQPDAVRAATDGPLRTIDGTAVGGCAPTVVAGTAAAASAAGTCASGAMGATAATTTATPTAAATMVPPALTAPSGPPTSSFRFVHVNAADVSRAIATARRRERGDDEDGSNVPSSSLPSATDDASPLVIVDVRAEGQVELCGLVHLHPDPPAGVRFIACPLPRLEKLVTAVSQFYADAQTTLATTPTITSSTSATASSTSNDAPEAAAKLLSALGVVGPLPVKTRVAFLCRRGRASVMATHAMLALQRKLAAAVQDQRLTAPGGTDRNAAPADPLDDTLTTPPTVPAAAASIGATEPTQRVLDLEVVNVKGGLNAWSREADTRLPFY